MQTRRSFLQSAMAALFLPATLGEAQNGRQDVPSGQGVLLDAPCGRLRGESANGIRIFRGVPFAEPPVGPLRFRPPQPLARWEETRNALRFAPAAIQPAAQDISEDCLYLNIWSPERAQRLPVLVWIHGGGFTGGRTSDPLQDGSVFARDGVVCVTVAYRLGAFGFLDVSPMLGNEYRGSANNALRDLILALEWVKDNIAAFGGDPARVTIAGESAGAKLADMLLGSSQAQPLFHQVISESGGAERCWSAEQAQGIGRSFAACWQKSSGQADSTMRTAPAAEILAAQEVFYRDPPVHFPLRAEVDGQCLREFPIAAIAAGMARGKRLLIGTNREESALFLGPKPEHDPEARDLGNLTVAQFDGVEAAYRRTFPSWTPEQIRLRSVTAEEYLIPSIRVADAFAHKDGEVFLYRLDFPGSGRYAGLAYHSFDLRFVWEEKAALPAAAQQTLATRMHDAWVAFIKGDQPAAAGLPAWTPYTAKHPATMLFDDSPQLSVGPQAEEIALWRGFMEP